MPVIKLKCGQFDIAVWEQDLQGMDRKAYQITLTRNYLNKKTNSWEKQTMSLFDNNCLELAQLLEWTYREINLLKTKQSRPAVEPQPEISNKDFLADIEMPY